MATSYCVWLTLSAALLGLVNSANILAIFPTASYSHQMPLMAVARALAEKGHNLTVITCNPFKDPVANFTQIDISFTYDYWKPKLEKPLIDLQRRLSPLDMLKMFPTFTYKIVDLQLQSEPLQNFIKYVDSEKPKFDLVLYEDMYHPAYLGFLPKLGHPPLISMLTLTLPCSLDNAFGNICNPSYVPDIMLGFTSKMTFFERLQNFLWVTTMYFYVIPDIYKNQKELMKKYFGLSSPTPGELVRNKSLLMVTSSRLFENPRPLYPFVVHVGPTHIGGTKPLPEDLDKWIEGAEEGVIYFSLGSNMRSASLEESKRSAILAAFARFPRHRIIWKWEEDTIPGLPGNVITRKWLPQHDLLAHPKIHLFITQGGLQSMQEAVYFEVPMIGIPFFADQDYNVKIVKRLNIGDFIDFDDITADALYNVMNKVLSNQKYMNNVKRISAVSKTQMMPPRDSAVWWVEYVLKHGGHVGHLTPENWDISWIEYNCLDVLFVVLSSMILALYGIYKLISRCRRRLTTSSRDKLKKS